MICWKKSGTLEKMQSFLMKRHSHVCVGFIYRAKTKIPFEGKASPVLKVKSRLQLIWA